MIARIIAFLLRKDLSVKDRTVLVNAIINSMDAPPIRAVFAADDNRRLIVNGKYLTPEEALSLRESANALVNNPARALIRDQVRFSAIDTGFLKNEGNDPVRELFYKAALWYAQEEGEIARGLAGQDLSTRED